MKKMKLIFALLLLATYGKMISQDRLDLEIGGNYYFNEDYQQLQLDDLQIVGNTLNNSRDYSVSKGYIVKLVEIKDGKAKFKFWNFSSNPVSNKTFNSDPALGVGDLVFELPTEDFENFTDKRYNWFRGVKAGAYSVPIRLRSSGKTFEFDSNLSLGANIAGTFGLPKHEHLFMDVSAGLSLTKVNLTPDNSNLGLEGSDFEDVNTLSPNAITFSLGLVFHPAKHINVGVFLGWDALSGTDQQKLDWIHNKRHWVGLGINIGFTKSEANKGASKKQSK